uniref:Uncharacterized protein n=1 Tax=Cannabis sativa TaxID=3483 RepID=A0A803QEI0_CANSA
MVREKNQEEAPGALVHPTLGIIKEEDELEPRVGVERIIESMEEIEEVCTDKEDPTKVIKVGQNLPPTIKEKIVSTEKENHDVLAWCHSNMIGISPHVICDALNIDKNAYPIRQKQRPIDLVWAETVKVEVEKFTSVEFLREALYPVW